MQACAGRKHLTHIIICMSYALEHLISRELISMNKSYSSTNCWHLAMVSSLGCYEYCTTHAEKQYSIPDIFLIG